ncbi:MAG: hypothetical protein ACRDFT_01545, partial [bacterium]
GLPVGRHYRRSAVADPRPRPSTTTGGPARDLRSVAPTAPLVVTRHGPMRQPEPPDGGAEFVCTTGLARAWAARVETLIDGGMNLTPQLLARIGAEQGPHPRDRGVSWHSDRGTAGPR